MEQDVCVSCNTIFKHTKTRKEDRFGAETQHLPVNVTFFGFDSHSEKMSFFISIIRFFLSLLFLLLRCGNWAKPDLEFRHLAHHVPSSVNFFRRIVHHASSKFLISKLSKGGKPGTDCHKTMLLRSLRLRLPTLLCGIKRGAKKYLNDWVIVKVINQEFFQYYFVFDLWKMSTQHKDIINKGVLRHCKCIVIPSFDYNVLSFHFNLLILIPSKL